jgi:glyoxylase-like metal-dependent hydrolase (beta-lactamase superfamily II)
MHRRHATRVPAFAAALGAVAVLAAGCRPAAPPGPGTADPLGTAAGGAGGVATGPAGAWYAGGAACAGRPAFRVREVAPGLFVLRQPACTNFEKPFLYLLVGGERALLLDTGAGGIDVAAPVDSLLGAWRARHGGAPGALVVAHSHGHGDHVAGDDQFRGRPGVTLVAPDSAAVHRFFALGARAGAPAAFDLGGRTLDVLAIPGHEPASIAVYDRATRVLLTGDTFYPGRLYVRDTAAFAASTARLAAFAAARPVAAVLGTHIEQTRAPYVDYPEGTRDQPAEDRLALSGAELASLDSAVRAMRGRVVRTRLPRFTIWPL